MIESEIFRRSKVDFNKLLEYGFTFNNEVYSYSKNIMSDTFKVVIIVDLLGNITGKIYDLSFNEEYTSFRNEKGSFSTSVKNEYIALLQDIKENCYINNYFINNQTNRITNYIINKYNCYPEFLWASSPNFGVFRNEFNKWFAIVMNIDINKLGEKYHKEIEIINIKLNKEEIDTLLKEKGFYKAYHMNKNNWLTISLCDNINDKKITDLIDKSYLIVRGKL